MSAANMAVLDASTKRTPAVSGGIVAAPVTYLAAIRITPLQSVNAALALEANIQDPREAKRCHAFTDANGELLDIREGDVLVVDGSEYPIQSVAEYNRPGDGSYLRLIVQERKLT